ncbi:MAG: hypothetical protein LIP02_08800 [Bacteroidales bacterium]|nr:hypothetical protein [Bacteroidales bacterium]
MNTEKEQEEKEEIIILKTPKAVAFAAIWEAADACRNLTDLRDKLEDLLGEEFPLVQTLSDAVSDTNRASNIIYNLGVAYQDFEDALPAFEDWISRKKA